MDHFKIDQHLENNLITKLKKLHTSEHNKSEIDLTLPGFNYLGPGTKVIHNLIHNLKPTSDIDNIALNHDVNYLLSNNIEDIKLADKIMVDDIGLLNSGPYNLAFKMKSALGLDSDFISGLSDQNKILLTKFLELRQHQWSGSKIDHEAMSGIISPISTKSNDFEMITGSTKRFETH